MADRRNGTVIMRQLVRPPALPRERFLLCGRSRGPLGLAVAATFFWPIAKLAADQAELVTIEGGVEDASAQRYSWIVTNHSTSPIVHIEFPHYRAGLFFTPEGWSQENSGMVKVRGKNEPGVCRATASAPFAGILPGGSATFAMQIGAEGAQRGRGTVQVRFADGKVVGIANVELPRAPAASTKYMALIGLAAIFIVVVVIREKRRRKAPPAQDEQV